MLWGAGPAEGQRFASITIQGSTSVPWDLTCFARAMVSRLVLSNFIGLSANAQMQPSRGMDSHAYKY